MAAAAALAELEEIPWRKRTDERLLRRNARIWLVWTAGYTLPFLAAAVILIAL